MFIITMTGTGMIHWAIVITVGEENDQYQLSASCRRNLEMMRRVAMTEPIEMAVHNSIIIRYAHCHMIADK